MVRMVGSMSCCWLVGYSLYRYIGCALLLGCSRHQPHLAPDVTSELLLLYDE